VAEESLASSNTPRTPTVFLIQQSCVIITFVCQVIVRMHTREEKNGVAKEAIVLRWVIRTTLWDFKHAKKRWAGALLSGKSWCFVQKPSCLSWKHSKMNG